MISCVCRLVKEGDTVSMGDALCEVQSDKVLGCTLYIVIAALQLVENAHRGSNQRSDAMYFLTPP